jgi:hypothetical protein
MHLGGYGYGPGGQWQEGVQDFVVAFETFFSASAAISSTALTATMSHVFITAVGAAILGMIRTVEMV